MGVQFVPTGRLPFLTDLLRSMRSTRCTRLSRIAFFWRWRTPSCWCSRTPITSSRLTCSRRHGSCARGLSFLFLLALIVTSVWRQWLRISYEAWRVLHNILSVGVVGFALYHIFKVDYYTSSPLQRWLWIAYGVICGG